MYFEFNRSSDEGMLAVGTVVMNRRESGRFPRTICGVVGQPNQFAPGALTSPMNGVGKARALRNADRVLAGARMPGMQNVMFFHTAGLDFPYSNMQYRLVAGGNAFYEKRSTRPGEAQVTQLAAIQRQQAVEPPAPPVSPRRLAATGGYVSPAMEDFGASLAADGRRCRPSAAGPSRHGGAQLGPGLRPVAAGHRLALLRSARLRPEGRAGRKLAVPHCAA